MNSNCVELNGMKLSGVEWSGGQVVAWAVVQRCDPRGISSNNDNKNKGR